MNAFEAIVKLIADPASLKNLQSQINGRNYTAKVKADTTQVQKAVSDLARLTKVSSMQTWANNNSKAMKAYGTEINGIISKMGEYEIVVPKEEISLKTKDIRRAVGKQFEAIVTEISRQDKKIIASIRMLEEQIKENNETLFWSSIFINKIVRHVLLEKC